MVTQGLRLLKGGIDLDAPESSPPSDQGLESLRREHRLILQAAGEGIYGLDLEGRAIFVNPAAAAMTGHSPHELLGRSMHEVVHHSHPSGEVYARDECPIYAAIRDGTVRRSGCESFWRKDGTPFPVEYTSTPIIEGRSVVGAVVVFRDVTARQVTEDRLQRALHELRELKAGEHGEEPHPPPRFEAGMTTPRLVGASPEAARVLDLIRRAASSDLPVLVQGESGTGKELVCRAIHEQGPRRARPLVSVNCAAISPALIESELFGHERGAFTGALALRRGRFEQAAGGTLFFDEIGELPLESQGKLLRVLQEKIYQRVGGDRNLRVTARVIAATNRDLRECVRAGKFRADLYYRLHVLSIEVPPLRQRRADVRLLAEHFLRQSEHTQQRRFRGFAPGALERLERHDWPGNVRELQHTIERAVLLCDEPELTFEPDFPGAATTSSDRRDGPAELSREEILNTLERTRFRISGPHGAALALGLHPNTLRSRMQRLGLTAPRRS